MMILYLDTFYLKGRNKCLWSASKEGQQPVLTGTQAMDGGKLMNTE